MNLKTSEYLVRCIDTNESEICFSQDHAIDVAWSMYEESGTYVYVEDWLGHTVIEYGDIELPEPNTFEHLGYNKPYDIIDDCLMSYESMEVV